MEEVKALVRVAEDANLQAVIRHTYDVSQAGLLPS